MDIDRTKKYLTKFVSIILISKGLYDIGFTVKETFRLVHLSTTAASLADYQVEELIKKFIIESFTALAETGYGIILLLTHNQKLKIIHYLIAAIIFAAPYLLTPKLIKNLENQLPQAGLNPLVYAQTSPEQALADYQFQLQQYRSAHKNYLSAKNSYLSFQTLSSRTEAVEKTKILLEKRAAAQNTYLFTLKAELISTPGLNRTAKNSLISQLESYQSKLSQHQQQLTSITSVEQINANSKILEELNPQLQVIAYQSLYNIFLGQLTDNSVKLSQQNQALKQLLNQADPSTINLTQANQWTQDTQSALTQNQTNYLKAQSLIDKIKTSKNSQISNQRNFSRALKSLDNAKQQLLKVADFLKENIKLIKYEQ